MKSKDIYAEHLAAVQERHQPARHLNNYRPLCICGYPINRPQIGMCQPGADEIIERMRRDDRYE